MPNLAIVIPAYKAKYFGETLSSLANQTNGDFNVYIGDDCSPYDLVTIVNQYTDRLNITYKRFSNNIGAKNIVDQWNRCVQLIKDEQWIWLFSDDDLMDPGCVDLFYQNLTIYNDKLAFRFNVNRITIKGEIIPGIIDYPVVEHCEDLIYHILTLKGGHGLVDHVYNAKALRARGGFVNTDYAQGADWATSILMALPEGLVNMKEASVYWRMSLSNISSQASSGKRSAMLKGHIQFLDWVYHYYKNQGYLKTGYSKLAENKLSDLLKFNFELVVNMHYRGISIRGILKFKKKLGLLFDLTPVQTIRYLFRLYINNNPRVRYLHGLFRRKKRIFS